METKVWQARKSQFPLDFSELTSQTSRLFSNLDNISRHFPFSFRGLELEEMVSYILISKNGFSFSLFQWLFNVNSEYTDTPVFDKTTSDHRPNVC